MYPSIGTDLGKIYAANLKCYSILDAFDKMRDAAGPTVPVPLLQDRHNEKLALEEIAIKND